MAENIALIAINNSLSNSIPDNNTNNEYLSLLDKYRKFITILCLNCKCDQISLINTNGNKLHETFHELENEYKNLLTAYNNNDIENRKTILNTDVNNDFMVKQIKPEPIDDYDEQTTTTTAVDMEYKHIKKENEDNIKDNAYNMQIESNSSFGENTSQVFIGNIIDVETEEISTDNCLATKLISKKYESFNEFIGYRCKHPKCQTIETNFDEITKHIKFVHNITKPFMCLKCNQLFENGIQLIQHKADAHNPKSYYDAVYDDSDDELDSNSNPKQKQSANNDFTNIKLKEKQKIFINDNGVEVVETTMNDNRFVKCRKLRNGSVIGYGCKWPQCQYFMRKKSNVYIHVMAHTGFICMVCDKQFPSKKQLKRHKFEHKKPRKQRLVRKEVVDETDVPVIMDGKIFYKNHWIGFDTYDKMLSDTGKLAAICSNKFESQNLTIGFRCLHTECGFISGKLKTVVNHIHSEHSLALMRAKGKRIKCFHCDLIFKTKADRLLHRRIQHSKKRRNKNDNQEILEWANNPSVFDEPINNTKV